MSLGKIGFFAYTRIQISRLTREQNIVSPPPFFEFSIIKAPKEDMAVAENQYTNYLHHMVK
jgi:hypothetical protein